ncbi:DEAD-box ATP-dependent RNA helicase 38 [Vitis vinifera]|uniref:RNA helicase n=1 Tax=Vitis vinifera TaxID=29760 RepID=A0A438EJN4_VITVI|nr:DEAD-box ATP-dependent RNA helicase 38 [Vitis vinifera]
MNCDSQNDPGEDGFVMTKALPGYDSRSESLDSFRASFTLSLFAVHQQSSLSDLLSMPEELWGDVEDDPPSLESLPIDESLDEPEDSSIQVVMTSYSRSLLDVVLIPPLNARFCLIDRKCWGKNRSGKFLIYSNDLTAGLLGWMNVTSGDTPYTSASTFEDLNLSPELLRGIYSEMKFERPSKIQAISLPMILTPPYKNLIAQAHNGSGKTTCFVLGMLSRVDPKLQVPQALCICPTRELAIQRKFNGAEFGGASANYTSISQRPLVKAQVVIGTPGTVKKWMSHRKLGMSNMKILVFDEADHMLAEDGFKDDSLRIMKDIERSGAQCQVCTKSSLLLDCTCILEVTKIIARKIHHKLGASVFCYFNDTVKNFVTRIVKDYNQMFVKKEELSLQSVKQYKVKCPDELSKILVIKDKIFELGQKLGQTIIFVRTKNSAGMLHKALVDFGYEVTTIQGALRQEDRDKIIKEFKDGLTQVLISTDLLARGFDQSRVNLVVNYDLPLKYGTQAEPDYEVYLHRIGRAGRFGRKGAVFNLLCSDKDNILISKIENHFGVQIAEIPSWQNDDDFEAAMKDAGLC